MGSFQGLDLWEWTIWKPTIAEELVDRCSMGKHLGFDPLEHAER